MDLSNKGIKKIIVNNKNEYAKIAKLKQDNSEYNNIDVELDKEQNILEKYEIEHVAGLIGVDRIYGNMTISFIWYNKEERFHYG